MNTPDPDTPTGTPPEVRRAGAARRLVTEAIDSLVLTEYGPAGFQETGPGGAPRRPRTDLALMALVALRHRVAWELRDAARRARGDGMSWEAIGAVLGLGPTAAESGLGEGEAAWRFAAYGVEPGTPVPYRPGRDRDNVTWRCGACGEFVTEYHPDTGPIQEAQAGHAGDCARVAATAAAERAARGEEDA